MARTFIARTKGICPACKQPFAKGDQVTMDSDLRRYHPGCRENMTLGRGEGVQGDV